jgi:ribosomal protein L40E
MPLFDKIGDFARNLGDKASSAIETTKLNNKINAEKTSISEYMRQIGEYYFGKHQAGEPDDPNVAEYFAAIESHNQAIAEAQAEIVRIQAEAAAQSQAAQGAAPAPVEGSLICPSCGAVNPPGTNFCSECGSKIEPPAAPEPQPEPEARFCPGCGAQVALTAKFCGECGYRFEG